MAHFLAIIADGVLLGLIYALVALGLSLVMGIMGVANVAHSAFAMVGSFMAFELSRRIGVDPIASFFIALPLFFAVGIIVYQVLVIRIEQAQQSRGLVAMFGLMVLIENLGVVAWSTDVRVLTAPYTNMSIAVGPLNLAAVRLIAGGLALILIVAVWLFMRVTLIGRAMRAMAQERQAAMSLGIDVQRLAALLFGLGIACAGAAGVVLAMIFPFSPSMQVQWLAWAFLVVTLGGLGGVAGTLTAGIIVGVLQTLLAALLPFDYVYLALYVALAAVLILRREALSFAQRRAI
jgi:branched-chain amino acid transport system permease protein